MYPKIPGLEDIDLKHTLIWELLGLPYKLMLYIPNQNNQQTLNQKTSIIFK